MTKDNDQTIVIDVRQPFEFSMDHVVGALNIPLESLKNQIDDLGISKDTPIIVYCRTGSRSERALQILESAGFGRVKNGINAQTVRSSKE